MQRRHFGMNMLAVTSTVAFPFVANAQTKPLKIIVPFTAGSGSDEGARFYAEQLAKVLNRTVLVDNKPGASGVVAVKAVLGEPADGNTILLGSNSLIAVNPVMLKDMQYDPFKDLVPLHGIGISSPVFITGHQTGITSIIDIKNKYKKDRQPVSIGNYSEGYRLVGEWLSQELGIKSTPVPYRGGSPMVTDVIGNRLDIAINDIGGVMEMEKGGKLKMLAITGDKRERLLPHIPTMKELGFKDFETYVWSSFSMKAGTSKGILTELAQAISIVQSSELSKKFREARPGEALVKSLDELGEFQQQEYLRFKKIANMANIFPS